MTRSLEIKREKGFLLHALARLVQVITLILLMHFVQAALAFLMGLLRLLITITQPGTMV
jgi:hypothetical protein